MFCCKSQKYWYSNDFDLPKSVQITNIRQFLDFLQSTQFKIWYILFSVIIFFQIKSKIDLKVLQQQNPLQKSFWKASKTLFAHQQLCTKVNILV